MNPFTWSDAHHIILISLEASRLGIDLLSEEFELHEYSYITKYGYDYDSYLNFVNQKMNDDDYLEKVKFTYSKYFKAMKRKDTIQNLLSEE